MGGRGQKRPGNLLLQGRSKPISFRIPENFENEIMSLMVRLRTMDVSNDRVISKRQIYIGLMLLGLEHGEKEVLQIIDERLRPHLED